MIQEGKRGSTKRCRAIHGTIVRSARYPKTWGVVYDAVIRNKDMNGNPIISYSVSWCQEDPKSNSRGPLFGPTPLVTVEAEYDLIYILFPPKQRNAWFKCIQMVTVFTLLVGILLALLLPGGTLMLIVWLRSRHAEKQRELLKKINNKRKLTLKKNCRRNNFDICVAKKSKIKACTMLQAWYKDSTKWSGSLKVKHSAHNRSHLGSIPSRTTTT